MEKWANSLTNRQKWILWLGILWVLSTIAYLLGTVVKQVIGW